MVRPHWEGCARSTGRELEEPPLLQPTYPGTNQGVDSLSLQRGTFLSIAQDVPALLLLPGCLLHTVFALSTAATLRGFE